jgi:hypothetical protein
MSENEEIPSSDLKVEESVPREPDAKPLDVLKEIALMEFMQAHDRSGIDQLLTSLKNRLPEHTEELSATPDEVSLALTQLEQAAKHQLDLINLLGDVQPLTSENASSAFDGLTSDVKAEFAEAIDRFNSAPSATQAIEEIKDLSDTLAKPESYTNPVTEDEKNKLVRAVVRYARLSVGNSPQSDERRDYLTPEFLAEIKKNTIDAKHYLEFLAGSRKRFEWVNFAFLNFSGALRPHWVEELTDWFEIRKKIDPRLDTECAKYRWGFQYRDRESLQNYTQEQTLGAIAHAHIDHHIDYLATQELTGGLTAEQIKQEERFNMMVMVDEKHRGDFQFDVSKFRQIKDDDLRRNEIHLEVIRQLGFKDRFHTIDLSGRYRAALHDQAYSNNRKDKKLYSEFYKSKPKYIINYHTGTENVPDSIFDPKSLGMAADSDWCLTYDKADGDLQYKVNHRWNGLPVAPWLIDITDNTRDLLDYYKDSDFRVTNLETLARPKIGSRIAEQLDRVEKRVYPIQEAVEQATFYVRIPYATFDLDNDGQADHKYSESIVLAQTIAMMNNSPDIHMLVEANEVPWRPRDVRVNNLMAAVIGVAPFLIISEPAYFQRSVKETTGELKRAKRNQAVTALLSAPFSPDVEKGILPTARWLQDSVGFLVESHGEVSVTPSFMIDADSHQKLSRFSITCFDTARPQVQTHESFKMGVGMDSIGVVGVTDDPITGETKISVRLEPTDVPVFWMDFVRNIRNTPVSDTESTANYYAALDPLIKQWLLYCKGSCNLREFEDVRNEAFIKLKSAGIKKKFKMMALVKKGQEQEEMFPGEWSLDSPDDLTATMNNLLQAKAASIIDHDTILEGLHRYAKQVERCGGVISYRGTASAVKLAQAA